MLEEENTRSTNTTNFRTLAAHLPGDIRVAPDSIHTYKLWIKRRERWFESLDKAFKNVILQWTADYSPITHLFPFDGYWYFRYRTPTWDQIQHWLLFDYQERINMSMYYSQEEDLAHHEIYGWLCLPSDEMDYETTLQHSQQKKYDTATDTFAWGVYTDFCTALRIWKSTTQPLEEEREEN